ncbi:MAG: YfhO family protein [Clostridia bacterium]|nr:YfhO family protein [Clostridia bacterium]
MTFSRQRLHTLRPQKSKAASTFFIALLCAAAIFIPYMIADSGYFLFYGDFNVQQIPFYQRAHELVRTGNVGWDFGTDLGVNFIGSYTFYLLGSPFFWLTLPFPNAVVPYLMGPLLILKFACCAWAAYMYLSRFLKNHETARLMSLLYAFSGFSVYNIFFNHFHEALIVFPLLLLSVELLITENRRGVFAFMVCVAAVTNYFFFFGMVVFTVIYWFVRVLSGAIKVTPGRFFSLLFEAVAGLLLSAFILLPAAAAIFGNSRLSEVMVGWGALLYGKEQIYANALQCFFFPPDLPARPIFFPGADVKWSSLGGWLPIFSMVGVFAWMGQKRGHWLRRLLAIMIFMAMVPVLNSAFYMFNSAYYARWYYMPILMMCLATGMALECKEINWKRPLRWVGAITVLTSLIIGFFPDSLDENGKVAEWGLYVKDDNNVFRDRFILTCAIAIISLIILKILLSYKEKSSKFFFRGALCTVCAISVIYASVFVGTGKTHSYDEDTVMIPMLQNELKLPGDKGDYRIDAYECVDNTGMYFDYNCINAFHSIVPSSVTEFYEFIGEERGVASRPTTTSYAARPLLSVKYVIDLDDGDHFQSGDEKEMPGYNYLETQHGYDIYENENYIPYGFTYDYYMTREDAQHFGSDNASNMMLKAMLLEYDQIKKYDRLLSDIKSHYTFDSYDGDKESVYFDDETFAADCAARAATAAYEFTEGKNSFTAKIKLDRENLVFFSIPYEEGWTAYVNGAPAEIEKVNIGFMAVVCPEGDNEIVFKYSTPGLSAGIIVSIIALVALSVWLVLGEYYKKRHPREENYPEGDELIARWQAEDAAEALAAAPEEISDEQPQEQPPMFPGGFIIVADETEKNEVDNGDCE